MRLTLLLVAALALTSCSKTETAAVGGPAKWNQQAPASFKARFETTAGPFTVDVQREWAPLGADRFYNLVKSGYFDGARFFRVVPGFVIQFGLNADPAVTAAWKAPSLVDDPVRRSNGRGFVTFATSGPNSRTTQLFINVGDNMRLDQMGFSPFGLVTEGMESVDKINAEYGESPQQSEIEQKGDAYLAQNFPKLDKITKATIQ
ncbi:MAG: peptidylprolyl isomerase [Bryobacteraceae bacterium]|nr:peptidylprolyl isomerase [Bryobacteraceae bacterium]